MSGGLNKIASVGFGTTTYDANISAFELAGVKCLGLGVVSGLVLSAGSGLTLNISTGYLCGRKVQSIDTKTATCPASATSYVWMDDDGDITFSASAAHPGGNIVCLGCVVAGASTITSVSTINRMTVLSWSDPYTLSIGNGLLTIDIKNQLFKVANIKGNGVALASGFANITGSKTDADYTLIAAEYECPTIKLGWTGWATGRNVIVPATTGAIWDVINATGQAATIKAATGTGVTIASGKAARVLFDGTNVVRLTADA